MCGNSSYTALFLFVGGKECIKYTYYSRRIEQRAEGGRGKDRTAGRGGRSKDRTAGRGRTR